MTRGDDLDGQVGFRGLAFVERLEDGGEGDTAGVEHCARGDFSTGMGRVSFQGGLLREGRTEVKNVESEEGDDQEEF